MSLSLLILRCVLPPPKKKVELPLEKNLTSHPMENLEYPDKKLNSLGIILIP